MFVAGVTGIFFLFGVAFGVLAVIAASARRGDTKRVRRGSRAGWPTGWDTTTEAGWEEPPGPGDGGEDDTPPRWPGGPSRPLSPGATTGGRARGGGPRGPAGQASRTAGAFRDLRGAPG
jgi:hypothetical protein